MTESLAILFHECDAAGDIDNLCQYVLFLSIGVVANYFP